MTTLQKPEDLAAVLGEVIDTDSPLEALKTKGFTFSADLQKQLAAKPPKTLSPQERARWVQKVKEIGPVKFAVRTAPKVARSLPVGEYDFIFGLRLGVINDVLAALYESFTWPHEIAPDTAGQLFTLEDLRSFADGIPEGENIQVGALHFTEPASVSPVPGTDHLILHQPFSLDIDRVIFRPLGLGTERTRVSSLDGTLSVGVAVSAKVEGQDQLRFVLDGVFTEAGTQEAVHIAVASDSSLQPRSPQALTDLERKVHNRFSLAVITEAIQQSYSISPEVRLPLGGGVPIRVQRVDVRSVSAGSEGALVVGVLLGPTSTPDEGTGDPARLRNPFTTAAANLYTRVHEELLRKVVRQALDSGELQRQASAERDDLKIEDADIELKPNELRLTLKARLVDACSFNKDLGFTATRTYHYSVFGGEITVTVDQNVDLDDSDVAVCLVLGGLESLIAFLGFGAIGFIADIVSQVVHFVRLAPSGGDDGPMRLSGVFQLDVPVPGTEVLPRAETLQIRVEERFMEANGVASLIPDEVNTYVYAAFQRRSGLLRLFAVTTPIENAKVELVDQDVPQPGGDDVAIPPPKVTTRETTDHQGHNRKLITTTTSFKPPTSDQVLMGGTTNSSGLVKFVLRPDQLRTTAGTLVTKVVVENISNGGGNSTDVTEEPIWETRPDVYFRVTEADGKKFNTHSMTGGFVLNLNSKRIGSASAPLTFTLGSLVVSPPSPTAPTEVVAQSAVERTDEGDQNC